MATHERRYDVVVIGGGNGGMAAACQVALAGRSVLLLERHNALGGFSTSFVRGRFEFEASLHELCELGPPGSRGILGRMLETLGVEVDWVAVPEAYRLVIPSEGLDVTMPLGVEAFVDAMEGYVPGSRASVARLMELARECWEAMVYVQDLQTDVRKLSKLHMLRRYPNFLKATPYSFNRVCAALGVPKKALDILSAYWCYLGVPLDRMDFSFYGYMVYDYLRGGAYVPKLRSSELAAAFEKRIRALGGEVELGVEVEKVLVEGGRARGVRTKGGETIACSQVICNASPYQLYGNMVEPSSAVPARARAELAGREQSVAGLVVFLGLDGSADELGIGSYSTFVYESSDSGLQHEALAVLGAHPMQATVCLNRAIPDASPPGTSMMMMTGLPRPDAWKGVRPEEYFLRKEEAAIGIIEDFERATGARLRGRVEEAEVSTPATYARYAKAYRGLIYGYATYGWDAIVPRILMMEEDVPIGGLRVASAYGARSDGYSSAMLNGRTMALYALEELEAIKGGGR